MELSEDNLRHYTRATLYLGLGCLLLYLIVLGLVAGPVFADPVYLVLQVLFGVTLISLGAAFALYHVSLSGRGRRPAAFYESEDERRLEGVPPPIRGRR